MGSQEFPVILMSGGILIVPTLCVETHLVTLLRHETIELPHHFSTQSAGTKGCLRNKPEMPDTDNKSEQQTRPLYHNPRSSRGLVTP